MAALQYWLNLPTVPAAVFTTTGGIICMAAHIGPAQIIICMAVHIVITIPG